MENSDHKDGSTLDSEDKPVTGQVLPPDEEEAIRKIVRVEVKQNIRYSGPLPQASEFRLYEETLEGTANRIIAMAEKEQDARIKSNNELIQAEIALKKRGQIFAIVITIIFCLLSLMLFLEKQFVAGTAVLAMIASLAYVFISGKLGKDTSVAEQEHSEED